MVSRSIQVTNFKDSGPGSLCDALKQSQASEGNRFDIIFDSTANPYNQLNTGYFTMRLKSPLPNIFRNNVTINQTNPRSVILVADTAANTAQSNTGLMSRSSPGRVNGSMLVVGDTNYIYPSKGNSTGNSRPDVFINNVSFIRNEAKGADGGAAGSGTNIYAGQGNFSTHGGNNGANGAIATNMGMGGGGEGGTAGGKKSFLGWHNRSKCTFRREQRPSWW